MRSSIVIVLESGACADATYDRPAPGGEPLWRVSRRPSTFRRNASPGRACENRRLPGITQRETFACDFRFG
jgi:hypothetical protein